MCPTTSYGNRNLEKQPNLRSAFDVLDSDGDGRISYDDLRAFYGGFSNAPASADDVISSMITVADSNENGYVEYEEFEAVVNGRRTRTAKNALMEEAFRVMDKDGDGKIGLLDLKSYFGWAGLTATEEDLKAMISFACGEGNDEQQGVTLDCFLKILAVG